jgi:outer membrane protein assembly factor BamB
LNALTRTSLALAILFGTVASSVADDWLAFRGTHVNGYSPDKNAPVKWTGTDNVAWKFQFPGPGSSSPIIVGDKVIATCYTGLPDKKDLMLHVICLDRAKGTRLWQKDLTARLPETPYLPPSPTRFIREHGYASSTPVSDGTNVYVFFGKSGVYAFDLKGNQLWHKEVGNKLHDLGWGSAASPVLHKNLLILNADIESGSLVALDKKTGDQVWKKSIGDNSWSTPVLVDAPGGKTEVVISMPSVVKGFDAETGDELWHCKGIDKFVTSSPVARDGIVYVTGGGAGPFAPTGFAVKTGGRGDVTANLLWKRGIGSGISSPVVTDKYLFATSGGKLNCYTRDKGEPITGRLSIKGYEYTSPTVASGKIYWTNRAGTTYVFSADDKMTPLGENHIEEDEPRFDGSPAVVDGQLFLRSTHYLYCIGKK